MPPTLEFTAWGGLGPALAAGAEAGGACAGTREEAGRGPPQTVPSGAMVSGNAAPAKIALGRSSGSTPSNFAALGASLRAFSEGAAVALRSSLRLQDLFNLFQVYGFLHPT